ncbi:MULTISPECIES: dioxygenase family protein [Microbacterium]|uniref:dioxygenase family protein n=1 Tax=Microbacterium TaxID=33882 RepID=UPI00217D07C5|nr:MULTISPECIES: 3,4-dioxygenase subunit beta [Microbacterium]UWF77647.1 3,4-dioxygenase subunit beta [Microbacterium neungamense]WCM55816.1 3,4-dioxygenase subunit beta [Microbacterium sp. EF45047]
MNSTDPRWLDANGHEIDEDHRGLVYDIRTLIDRRRALGIFGGIAATALLAACAPPSDTGANSTSTTGTDGRPAPPDGGQGGAPTGQDNSDLLEGEVPNETAGPYPADGSNGVNVLDDSGIVRSDIRSSFGSSATTAEGVPLDIVLTVRDATTGAAMAGAGVYLWHCDRDGNYSLYSDAAKNENYLRGVQETDDTGTVRFRSIYPACYSGRWPHIHFEVYQDVATAVATGPIVKTSQIALPEETNAKVYATSGYESSVRNASRVTLTGDNVFGDDGGILQLATMTGSVDDGYTAALSIAV